MKKSNHCLEATPKGAPQAHVWHEEMKTVRTDIFDRVHPLLARHDVKGFVVPANTGYSAKAALAAFGNAYQYIAVGNPTESSAKGYVHHSGMSEETRAELTELGMHVVLHEHSCFSQKAYSPAFWKHNSDFEASFVSGAHDRGVESLDVKGSNLSQILEFTLCQLCDQGFKTAVEMALLAGSCPQADLERYYVSFALPSRWGNFRDVAIISRIGTPASFFTQRLDMQAVVLSNEPKG